MLYRREKAMPSHTTRTEKLDLRLTHNAKRALQAAAAVAHRSVCEFVLESALSRADETLADRRAFSLNATQWQAFLGYLQRFACQNQRAGGAPAYIGLAGDAVIGYYTSLWVTSHAKKH